MTIREAVEGRPYRIDVTDTAFAPGAALEEFSAQMQPHAGAIASFSGYVRAENDEVESLFLQHYPGYTERRIRAIATDACTRWDILGLHIIHRCGPILPGEAIVFVAAAAAHRRAAFQSADFLMDYLKTRAPFWKKETGPSGTKWINPRDTDYHAAKRWEHR